MLKSLLTIFFLVVTLTTYAQTLADEYLAISETLNYYLDGGTYNDFATLEKAFHPAATMSSFNEGKLRTVNAPDFFRKGIKPGPKQDRQTKIVSVNLSGNAANAVLHIDYATSRFVDYMQLLKIDGKWKIISKMFTVENLKLGEPARLTNDEKEVLNVLHRWKMAMIHPNAGTINRILANDWTYAGGFDGKLGRKPVYNPNHQDAAKGLVGLEVEEVEVRFIADDVAIVSGMETMRGKATNK